ncbi:hypothetical protein V501_08971 [Pseudogymnoascus sp. VKM F-4519 (FW-2642)]|uniref:AMP-activated protein kinase glycogen-binding domain-containing protein n=1 Tax=Pseudogymnoascus verrucosus TaxID=342668 RepID=A0A1B8GDX5_9PEZI|nr:uncharacterized protein VE01_07090 [Pseudogymnoascus verrucosus]KFY76483.1 hypothetical protein V499_03905 [Pseudogymnoascus sp. VKM F-103]KFZ04792.1 hypothetical protein V501_08971 [Pseudogymnoascus sp. VKM F-4519 (FW-2642)]OBT94029.1 hypothetical protein VE01_07090 [Pseudogymnoascus verrucosus]
MSAIQLSFDLRTSSTVKTVHLLGSWDNYAGQLPLAKDKNSSKSGAWKGTFKFQGSLLQAGQRYWYYYIIDGYHVSHNPGEDSTTEPTTGRVLNILDVASDKSKSSKSSSKSSSSKSSSSKSSSSKHSSSSRHPTSSRRESRALTADIPKGRPLSISQIQSPKPCSPHATKHILEAEYGSMNPTTIEELTSRFSESTFDDYEYSSTPPSSVGSSLSSRSDSSSPSSVSSGLSDYSNSSQCSCERYGITRTGDRIKLDCGGSRCGYSDEDSCCSSSDDDEVPSSARRQGIVVRR